MEEQLVANKEALEKAASEAAARGAATEEAMQKLLPTIVTPSKSPPPLTACGIDAASHFTVWSKMLYYNTFARLAPFFVGALLAKSVQQQLRLPPSAHYAAFFIIFVHFDYTGGQRD